jgi:UDP:flavonoid glycosyltransferase YjiC (YdhE family)
MKIVLATFGSRGDVQPMLALSLALQSAGHNILLAAPPEKGEWIRQMGVPFQPLGNDITAFIDTMKDAHSIRWFIDCIRYLRKEFISQFQIFPKIIAGADLVLGASLVGALSSVAESMGIPYRFVAFSPSMLPSIHHPSPICKHQEFPKYYNRMTWQIGKIFNRLSLTALVNGGRKKLGLQPVEDAWLNILGQRVIVASDNAISAVPPDAKPTFAQTGYLHLHQPDQHIEELEIFLDAGPPPVYAGFGSMPKKVQIDNVSIIVQAARSAGSRVVIAKFWEEPSEFSRSDDVFFISKYPHLKLFPRTAGVIHHGGAGTTAASAASGVPQIVIPHLLDQYYWGHQVYQSNLGPKPIWRHRITTRKLAGAIREVLSNDLMRQKAKKVSRMIDRHNSLELAVREVLRENPEK